MKKQIRKTLCMALVLVLCLSLAAPGAAVGYVDRSETYQAEKISHPDSDLKQTDGLVDYVGSGVVAADDEGQGDRGQSYSWAAVAVGDDVYVATCYNAMGNTLTLMDNVLGDHFNPEIMTASFNALFNGHFFTGEPDGASTGGVLVKINVRTGEVKLLMSRASTGESPLFRNACTYMGKLYFCGSVNGLPSIYQIDPETDEHKMVYQGMTLQEYYQGYLAGVCTGIRGLCQYGDELIVSCVTLDGPMILSSTEPWKGQEAFTVIADSEDLFGYPATHYEDSIYGGSIWEMVEFGGHLYVSICTGTPDNMPDEHTMQSFALVRGDKSEDGTWTWTAVVGDQEKDGARYTFGIDPQRTRAGAGVLNVYGDYLYIGEYNDEEIALEDLIFNLDCSFLLQNLEQSVSLYRMDTEENVELVVGDATEMFPEGGLSGLGSGFGRHENQYIWRMESCDGKLYVGTFDTSSLLEPIGQFVNGDLATMSVEEWESLIGFIRTLIAMSRPSEPGSSGADRVKAVMTNRPASELANVLAAYNGENDDLDDEAAEYLRLAGQILRVARYLSTAKRGFDLYVSEDGVNFDTVTVNGFGDPFNHGLRVFAQTDTGLAIGTANPFYGTQLWLLNDGTCKRGQDCPLSQFVDTNPNAWYHDGVHFCLTNGLMVGTGEDTFAPNAPTTRAMVVNVLYRLSGSPDVSGTCSFEDVPEGKWFTDAVTWAEKTGVVAGFGGGKFGPNDLVTREQMAAMLCRFAASTGWDTTGWEDVDLTEWGYADADQVSPWALSSMQWAVGTGLIQGTSATTLSPKAATTRAALAVLLQRYDY